MSATPGYGSIITLAPNLPARQVTLQLLILDPGAASRWSATNALEVTLR